MRCLLYCFLILGFFFLSYYKHHILQRFWSNIQESIKQSKTKNKIEKDINTVMIQVKYKLTLINKPQREIQEAFVPAMGDYTIVYSTEKTAWAWAHWQLKKKRNCGLLLIILRIFSYCLFIWGHWEYQKCDLCSILES